MLMENYENQIRSLTPLFIFYPKKDYNVNII